MYQELLDIVRNGDKPDEETSASTAVTDYPSRAADNYSANMPIVAEVDEPEYPSFGGKAKIPQAAAA